MEKEKKQDWIFALSVFTSLAVIGVFLICFALVIRYNRSHKNLPCENCSGLVAQPGETHLEECGGCSAEFFTGCYTEKAQENPHIKICENCGDTYYDCPIPLSEKDVERVDDHGPGKCVPLGINGDLPDAPVIDKPRSSP